METFSTQIYWSRMNLEQNRKLNRFLHQKLHIICDFLKFQNFLRLPAFFQRAWVMRQPGVLKEFYCWKLEKKLNHRDTVMNCWLQLKMCKYRLSMTPQQFFLFSLTCTDFHQLSPTALKKIPFSLTLQTVWTLYRFLYSCLDHLRVPWPTTGVWGIYLGTTLPTSVTILEWLEESTESYH